MGHKVKLLGEVVITDPPSAVEGVIPSGNVLRLVVALALRPGQSRTWAELEGFLWSATDYELPKLSVPVAHARKYVSIPKSARGSKTYTTGLTRDEVDVTDFIDRVTAFTDRVAPNEVDVNEADALLGMWRGRPEEIYQFVPELEFAPLMRARRTLIDTLKSWSSQDIAQLSNLEHFLSIYPEEWPDPPRKLDAEKCLLLVDDDPKLTTVVTGFLIGYRVLVAHNVPSALELIIDSNVRIDGALVDLHLTSRIPDNQGLQVIDALRTYRSQVPRILMTSSPPPRALMEVIEDYGLFDILIKNSLEAPDRTRRIVDKMMSDQDESRILRAQAAFDTLASRVQKVGIRALVVARQAYRLGTGTAQAVEEASLALEQLDQAASGGTGELRQPRISADRADEIVKRYAMDHAAYLAQGGSLS